MTVAFITGYSRKPIQVFSTTIQRHVLLFPLGLSLICFAHVHRKDWVRGATFTVEPFAQGSYASHLHGRLASSVCCPPGGSRSDGRCSTVPPTFPGIDTELSQGVFDVRVKISLTSRQDALRLSITFKLPLQSPTLKI